MAHSSNQGFRTTFRLGTVGGHDLTPDGLNLAGRTDPDAPLLLFLAGSGHGPNRYTAFLAEAERTGYHVLGLDYANRGRSVVATCGDDPDCYTRLQNNRLTGTAPFALSSVAPHDSILARLEAAIEGLDAQDPEGRWGRFTRGEQIDWSRIVVAGHSQGGGQAAYIAHLHRVLGQLTFGAPIIASDTMAASWLTTPGATPPDAMYGFASAHDRHFDRIEASWLRLGLPADHRLVWADDDLGDAREAHGRVINDRTPRLPEGTPRFAGIWNAMLAPFLGEADPG